MLLGASFLGDSDRVLGTRSLVSCLAFVGSFLGGLCIGSFLDTYALNSLKRDEKQMYVYEHHTFLVKIKLILPYVGTLKERDLPDQPQQTVCSWEL